METQELIKIASQVRRDIVRMVHAVKSGHPGGSLGCNEFLTVLYQDTMSYSTDFTMDGSNEDLFFLSKPHFSRIVVSVSVSSSKRSIPINIFLLDIIWLSVKT